MRRCKRSRQSGLAEEALLDLTVLDASRDKRLVALVHLLARRAARKAYRKMLEERSAAGS